MDTTVSYWELKIRKRLWRRLKSKIVGELKLCRSKPRLKACLQKLPLRWSSVENTAYNSEMIQETEEILYGVPFNLAFAQLGTRNRGFKVKKGKRKTFTWKSDSWPGTWITKTFAVHPLRFNKLCFVFENGRIKVFASVIQMSPLLKSECQSTINIFQ